MQSDFEPVFERKFHSYLNCIEGVMHTGQRDMIRVRVGKAAFEAGFPGKAYRRGAFTLRLRMNLTQWLISVR